MEGSETGGAWVGTGLEDGGERDGRRSGGDGAGREDVAERDGRHMDGDGAGWGRGWAEKMEASETGGAWVGLGEKMRGARREAHGWG